MKTGEKVVELRRVSAEPDPKLVEWLQRLLAQAEAGELVGLAFVAAHRGDGPYELGMTGDCTVQSLIVGLEVLHYRLLKAHAEDDEK